MAYRDTWTTCSQCGRQFIFRVEEQRRQAERGEEITPPSLCPSCRALARSRRRPESRGQHRSESTAEQRPKTPLAIGPGPYEGSVKWYDDDKGYGFIIQESGEEIFFHRTGIAPGEKPDFPDGARVTYLIEETSKGPQAVEVAQMDVAE